MHPPPGASAGGRRAVRHPTHIHRLRGDGEGGLRGCRQRRRPRQPASPNDNGSPERGQARALREALCPQPGPGPGDVAEGAGDGRDDYDNPRVPLCIGEDAREGAHRRGLPWLSEHGAGEAGQRPAEGIPTSSHVRPGRRRVWEAASWAR